MPEIVRDGVRIAWASDGSPSRPPLLLSNSLGTTMAMWDPIVSRLAERYWVIRYDTRGHGESSVPPGDYSLDLLGRDALAVLDQAGVQSAAVCGISLGGLTAQWLALEAPSRVSRAVLANTGAKIGTDELWDQRIAAVRSGGLEAIVEPLLGRWFTPGFRADRPDVVAAFRAMIVGCSPAGYTGASAAVRDADFRSRLGKIRQPVLVIAGTEDVATSPALSEALVRGIAGARLEVLPTAHLSPAERPDDFATLILRFLQEDQNGALEDDARRARGRAVRAAVLGEAHVRRVEAAADPLTATFHDLLTRYAWGEIWTRPGLDHRARRVLVLGTLIALGRWEEFRLHARAALTEGGFTAAELEEIVLQQAIYCGVPIANTAFEHLRQALAG
jgi:3-oxoadipate enol-lactonase/4-carboxymuconolactone decarboxylase